MTFAVDSIDISGTTNKHPIHSYSILNCNIALSLSISLGITPSTLANAGLIMAVLVTGEGVDVASVNLVVNVFVKDGKVLREIWNPME